MHKSVQSIYFMRFFGIGILLPVLTLILLSRGATIETVSLFLGFYSVTVIASEFPSGVFADLYGRKSAFLLSCALSLLSYTALLFSRSTVVLFLGMLANGLSRAFSSGSLEALMIDDAVARQIPLERVTARITILESAGIASGSLAGGLLAEIGTNFSANLGANIVMSALLLLLTARFVQEAPRKAQRELHASHRQMFVSQIKDSLAFARQKGIIRVLPIFALLMGFSLSAIEAYWQPALASFSAGNWLFGVVSFGGFAFVMLGSWVSERVMRQRAGIALPLLFLLKALLGAGLVLFASTSGMGSIIVCYLGLYLLVGSSGVVENTLLNLRAPSSHRASILSLFSLVLQLGGVIASIAGYFVSTYSRYQNMWIIAGVLLLLFSVLAGALRKSPEKTTALEPQEKNAGKSDLDEPVL